MAATSRTSAEVKRMQEESDITTGYLEAKRAVILAREVMNKASQDMQECSRKLAEAEKAYTDCILPPKPLQPLVSTLPVPIRTR